MHEITTPSTIDRRTFMRRGAMGAGALWAVSLQELVARRAMESPQGASPYGPISPKIDQTTGLPLLMLPDGFTYLSYGWNGDRMSDGIRTPPLHDGMAVVNHYGGNTDLIVLVRNHEVAAGTPFATKPEIRYTTNSGGGTTNMIFDQKRGRFVKSFASLTGTIRNCAGGVTPWGTWITCEEDGSAGHGWCFDVGPQGGDPTPLTAMGRFSHEAIMVDPNPSKNGIVYQTEDNGANSGFYKFVPNVYGQLKQGGELFMLKLKNPVNPPFNNHLGSFSTVGTIWDVEWVQIDNPTSVTPQTVYQQGRTKGAVGFNRLEGAWWGWTTGFFLSTNGGSVGEGQVFEYDPVSETLKLIYNSANFNDCDNPDNLTVTPNGQLLLCEDAAGGGDVFGERLVGVTLQGQAFTFAQNNMVLSLRYNDRIGPGSYRDSEWAGACFSPDGKWLFVNIQTPGVTYAITGPWSNGPL
jgi:secreted PhoX family phosphatase